MPEGPEIRRAADQIAEYLKGRPARRVSFAFPHLKGYEPLLTGRSIERVQARGKAMLIHFAEGLSIYSHNQLYGRWVTTRTGVEPETGRQIRLALETDKGAAWLLSASDIEVLDQAGRDSPSDREPLAKASLHLFRQSYRTAGLTNDLELVESLKNQGVQRAKYRHWVFNRAGDACHRCGQEILKDVLAGRRLNWCPGCQSRHAQPLLRVSGGVPECSRR